MRLESTCKPRKGLGRPFCLTFCFAVIGPVINIEFTASLLLLPFEISQSFSLCTIISKIVFRHWIMKYIKRRYANLRLQYTLRTFRHVVRCGESLNHNSPHGTQMCWTYPFCVYTYFLIYFLVRINLKRLAIIF